MPPANSIFAGPSEAARLMRSINWSATKLGPVESWPQTLRTTIPLMLASRFAMRVVWGPEFVMLYNDAYLPVLGSEKHPRTMGSPTAENFPELWHIVGPMFERVYRGEAVAMDDGHLPLHRNGYLEECYFTLSYSPMRDDAGAIAGLLGVIHETTKRVLADRRMRTLRLLAAHAASATNATLDEACTGALGALGENVADVPYAILYLADGRGGFRRAAAVGVSSDSPAAPAKLDARTGPWAVDATKPRTVELDGRFGRLTGGRWPEPSRQAAILPLFRTELYGYLIVGISPRREYDPAYADFCELAANQIAVTLERHATELERNQLLDREQVALAEAERQRHRLETLFMQAPAAICVLRGRDHVFELANPRYRQLVGDRDVVGKPVRLALPEAASSVVPLLDRIFDTGEPFLGNEFPVQLQRAGATGEYFFNFIYQPIFDQAQRVEGVAVIAFDVTDQVRARKRTEQLAHELERTNQDLDQFAYVASHDLKAPLRGIANLSDWIEEALRAQMSEETRGHMDLLRGRVHRLEKLIDGILDYSRAGRVREKVESVSVAALLAECRDLLAARPPASITVVGEMPTLETERVPLQQVFLNLISNAIKHAGRPDAHVEISCVDHGDSYDFSVRDNGPGIPENLHERVWGIFTTLQSRDKVEGTGIGLSVVKKIVESRGGSVRIASQMGVGSTFHVVWPKRAAQPL